MSDTDPALEVHVDRQGSMVAATLRGELDLASVDTARAVLRPAVTDGVECLELDLADVTFVDSSGLAVFIELSSSVTVVVRSASTPVRRILETTGLQDVLGLTATASEDFPVDPTSIRAARRFVAGQLAGADQEWVDLVMLATSEVASNCVTHAQTAFTITVVRTSNGVRVAAIDDGGGTPEVRHPDLATPSGRGLLIVERLSEEWGSSVVDGRTEVWFRMARPTAGDGSAVVP